MGKKNHSFFYYSCESSDDLNLGFTLIELLIVITIIAALAVTVFVALNPVKRLADSRDARRQSDVETILTGIHEYIVDNAGKLPPSMVGDALNTDYMLGTGTGGTCPALTQANCVVTSTNCDNLAGDLTKYLKSSPVDPGSTYSAVITGYAVSINSNNIITVKACGGENNQNISQSR